MAVQIVALVQGVLVMRQLEEVTLGKPSTQWKWCKVSTDPRTVFANALYRSPALPYLTPARARFERFESTCPSPWGFAVT
jgi:hypothetical protein